MDNWLAFDDRDKKRLWSHIDKNAPGGCWICDLTNMCLSTQIKGRTVSYSIRRVVWLLERGEDLPREVTLIAMCGQSHCCNPAHMRKVKKGTQLNQLVAPTPEKRRREPLYLWAWLTGFDLKLLPNGRYRVVKVENE